MRDLTKRFNIGEMKMSKFLSNATFHATLSRKAILMSLLFLITFVGVLWAKPYDTYWEVKEDSRECTNTGSYWPTTEGGIAVCKYKHDSTCFYYAQNKTFNYTKTYTLPVGECFGDHPDW